MLRRLLFIIGALSLVTFAKAQSTNLEASPSPSTKDSLRAQILEMEKQLAAKSPALEKQWEADRQVDAAGVIDPLRGNGQRANTSALWNEIISIEGDIDNLIKDGFEENHPRVLALHAEVTRKIQQIRNLDADRYHEPNISYPKASLQAQHDYLEQLDQLITLNHHYQKAIFPALPP